MKTTSLFKVARQYNCTLDRACCEVLSAAGLQRRIYPAVIRRQPIPTELIRKARWHQRRIIGWRGYRPLNGPVGQLS